MKYIITESKLDEIRTNYLNDRVGSTSFFDNFIIIYHPGDPDDIEDGIIMEYDYEDGRLYINSNFGHSFSDLFFQNDEEAYKFMSEWFENKFSVVVEFSQT
jgi:hypothetical protein